MGNTQTENRNKRPVKPGLQRALEGIVERMREELDRLIPAPRPVPIPVPIPIPGRRYRR
jgi:hypothetical protein